MGFPSGSVVKNLPASSVDTFDPWVFVPGKSQAWQATVNGIAKD